jgi:hypothetical protein
VGELEVHEADVGVVLCEEMALNLERLVPLAVVSPYSTPGLFEKPNMCNN